MSSTKRARAENDSEKAEVAFRYTKKIKPIEQITLTSLPEELQMQILIHVPFKQLPQLRLVCSRWFIMTKSPIFGKFLCIDSFGEDISPCRISNLASLLSAADSELFLLPTICQGSRIMVDWLRYYELRELLDQYIKNWTSSAQSCEDLHDPVPHNSELSFLNVKAIFEAHYKCDCYMETLVPLVAKLVPLLMHYQRHETASCVFQSLCLMQLREKDEAMKITRIQENLQLSKSFLDLTDLSRLYFSKSTRRFYDLAMILMKRVCSGIGHNLGKTESALEYRQLFRRVLKTMIHEGATGPLGDSLFNRYFKQPFYQCYRVMIERYSKIYPELDLHSEIISVCSYEFNKSSDWRVQASAMAVCHVSSCKHQKFQTDKVRFALSRLAIIDLHPEVHRAAFFTLLDSLLRDFERLKELINDVTVFRQIMHRATQALLILPEKERHNALSALRISIFLFRHQVFTDAMLAAMHDNLFNLFWTPGLIERMAVDEAQLVIDNIMSIAWILKTKLKKYLPRYRSAILNLLTLSALNPKKISPEVWLAMYIDLGCFISDDFGAEAEQIVRQVEDGTVDVGASIQKDKFFASCMHAARFVSFTTEEYIERVLKIFPDFVLEGKLAPFVYSVLVDSDSSEESSDELDDDEYNNDEDMDVPDNVPLKVKVEKNPPEYLPHHREQWDCAVACLQSSETDPSIELFKFGPVPPRPLCLQDGIVPLKDNCYNMHTMLLRGELDIPEVDRATTMVIRWAFTDVGKKFAQKFLHIVYSHCLWGIISEDHIACLLELLAYLAPRLDDTHLTSYIGNVTKALCASRHIGNKVLTLSDTCVDKILELLLPVPNVAPDVLLAILRLSRGSDEKLAKDNATISRRLKVLDTIVTTWPRAAWTALQTSQMMHLNYFDTNDESRYVHQLWLLKLYGLKELAVLQDMMAEDEDVLDSLAEQLGIICDDPLVTKMSPKIELYLELCQIDPEIRELNYFNQFLFDQQKIKNALIKANKYPGEMKYYSELLF